MMKNQKRSARKNQKLFRWTRTKYKEEEDGSYKRQKKTQNIERERQ